MRGLLRTATALTLAVGVGCQFVQRTDPAAPLTYFTVDSAILLVAALLLATLRPGWSWVDGLRGAATVGTTLSAIVFAAVIAPASETGTWIQPHDDLAVRAANILLHGAGPVLALADYLLAPRRQAGGALRSGVRAALWPLAYLLVMLPLDLAGVAAIPYAFLDFRAAGVAPVLGAAAGLLVVVIGLGAGLHALHLATARARASGGWTTLRGRAG